MRKKMALSMAFMLISAVCAFPSLLLHNQNQNILLHKKKLSATLENENSNIGGGTPNNGDRDGSGANYRRLFLTTFATMTLIPRQVAADDSMPTALSKVQVVATGDAKSLFNEGRAFEAQGNVLAAQRLYVKVTTIAPRFIYGWSNLANTLVAQGQLDQADESYSKAISLCEESLQDTDTFVRTCDDLYLILLNRGSVRLNNGMPKEALLDIQRSDSLRAKPDAVVLQNLARAQELNSLYTQSDKSYNTAVSMTANEVNPFWLRSSLVKYQLGNVNGAMDLMKRVDNRFPQAPEVRAAYAVLLWAAGNDNAARAKFLEIPDRQRKKYIDSAFMKDVVSWPPKAIATIAEVANAVGDGP